MTAKCMLLGQIKLNQYGIKKENNMDNLQMIIKAKGDERIANKLSEVDAFKQETLNIHDSIINKYGKRVEKAIAVMNMIRLNDTELWEQIRSEKFDHLNAYNKPNYFFTDGWSHTLGFYKGLNAIGCEAGGACGGVNFVVTGKTCEFEIRNPVESKYVNLWSRDVAKRFSKSFEKFETRFRNFINEQYGDGAYDLF